jgi:tripeptide aminopeptidase
VALTTGMVDEHATTEHIAIDDLVMAAKILFAIVTGPAAD